jgi:Lanthionine-containing peptide SapB precursor RamS
VTVLDLQALDAKADEGTRLPSVLSLLACGTNSALSLLTCF